MSFMFVSILLTVIVGLAIAAQTQFAGVLGQHVGIIESVFIIHLGGLVVAGIYLLFMGGGNLGAWRAAPWYTLAGGLLGVVIVGGYAFVIPRIGLAPAITLAVTSQLIFSAVLSHFGVLGAIQQPLGLSRIVGIGVLLVGTWLIVR
ncbi:DMT family transporter [Candidatus Bipolaricaulota bacterium]|jgi:transporter family-2 protein|nr:DMT family transporter [Candidatus Bipolaricaulota bacterium]